MNRESTDTRLTLGYARVSTLEQDESLQRDALEAAGCDRLFVDKTSGKLGPRPALDAILEQVRAGDTVVVWRLDRLGRSLRHLIDIFADLERRGVAVRSLTESLDTTTPGGKIKSGSNSARAAKALGELVDLVLTLCLLALVILLIVGGPILLFLVGLLLPLLLPTLIGLGLLLVAVTDLWRWLRP